jgi:hypothetical protein
MESKKLSIRGILSSSFIGWRPEGNLLDNFYVLILLTYQQVCGRILLVEISTFIGRYCDAGAI